MVRRPVNPKGVRTPRIVQGDPFGMQEKNIMRTSIYTYL